ncbi:amidohydrolase family protein [Haliea sp. E17]|uniref:amidohydrolase family protein n=1 Tax=Haliea sp. E17 TaxID=3401576 RepID=UPI003AAF229D
MSNSASREVLITGALLYTGGRGDIRIAGNRIVEIGTNLQAAGDAERIDASGCVAFPGLVNTHHHLFQSLLKGVPAGIDKALGAWLVEVPYQAWPHVTPENMYSAAKVGLSELLRSGCTTCADHHYLYHADTSPEIEQAILQAAKDLGMRLVLCRGGGTREGNQQGGAAASLAPEGIDLRIQRMQQLVSDCHDPAADAMVKIAVAPTSVIHASTPTELRLLGEFAREYGLRRHSHLLEVPFDQEMAMAKYGMAAIDYMEDVGWLGEDVWFAHLVHVDDAGLEKLRATRTGIAHCPTSNARLGSGVARAPAMDAAKMPVSLGVDGSASAESGSMVSEMLLAWMIHRAVGGPDVTSVEQIADWATRGGAHILGYHELGELAPGKLADIVLYDIEAPRFAGLWEPRWAPVICGEPITARHVMINGEWRVRDGAILGLDEGALFRDAQLHTANLVNACR